MLEMDLSFKMVRGKTNLYSLVSWDEDTQRMFKFRHTYADIMQELTDYRNAGICLRLRQRRFGRSIYAFIAPLDLRSFINLRESRETFPML